MWPIIPTRRGHDDEQSRFYTTDDPRLRSHSRSLTKKGGPGRSCPGLESQPRTERRTELRSLLVGPRLPDATTYKVKPPRDNLFLLHRSGKLRRRETLLRRSSGIRLKRHRANEPVSGYADFVPWTVVLYAGDVLGPYIII